MRHQPSQSKPDRSIRAFATPAKGVKGGAGFASAVLLASPFQGNGIAATQADVCPVFTVILAVLAGILGLSASLLYRHMHQREEELRRRADNAEAELRALLMMTDEAVLVLSADGTVRAANPASEEVFDRAAAEFVGEALTKVIAQPIALGELTKHGPVNFETTAKRGKDGFVQVEMLLSPVELATGKGYLAIVHQADATLLGDPKKRTAGKADVHGVIEKLTHDLNNQLTSVLGNLSLALMARPGDPATHQRMIDAKKTAIRAQSISHQMQTSINSEADGQPSKPETPNMTDMNCTIVPMPKIGTPSKVAPDRAAGPARILILDDEEAICMLVASVLDASGFEVKPATSVAAALQASNEAQESGDPFSLLICDLSLPGDVDGVQALKQLRAINPNLKAIVSSGYDSDPIMRDCGKFGFCAAMPKPYDVAKLVRTVGSVLAEDAPAFRKTA